MAGPKIVNAKFVVVRGPKRWPWWKRLAYRIVPWDYPPFWAYMAIIAVLAALSASQATREEAPKGSAPYVVVKTRN